MLGCKGSYEKSYFGIDFAGAGGIVSTVNDMLRWLAHMDKPTVGSASTWSTMREPQSLANGAPTGYGLGLMMGRYRGVETLSHPGGGMGGNAQMIKVPEAGLDVVVIVNRHDTLGMQLACHILDACLPAPDSLARGAPELVFGTFQSSRSRRVVQLFAKDGQQIVSIDGFDVPFVPDAEAVLHPAPMWSFLRRSVSLLGDLRNPRSLQLNDFGNSDQLSPVQAPGTGDESASVEGRYVSDQTDSELVIRRTGNSVTLSAKGRFGSAPYELECIGSGIWRARPASAMTLGGMVTLGDEGLSFHSYGTRALPFRRCA
jgi:hypothetical protein